MPRISIYIDEQTLTELQEMTTDARSQTSPFVVGLINAEHRKRRGLKTSGLPSTMEEAAKRIVAIENTVDEAVENITKVFNDLQAIKERMIQSC